MNNKDDSNKKDILRKFKNKYFWLFVGYQFFRIFCAYSQVVLLPLLRIILVLIGIDLYMCEIIMNAFNLLLLCAPSVCFFMGIKMLSNDLKSIKDLLISEEVNNFKIDRQEQRKINKIEIEYTEDEINQLVSDFKRLSRREQMECLNQLKEKRNLGTIKNMAVSDKLQNEFEDIMFPNFNEEESKGYTRKRSK